MCKDSRSHETYTSNVCNLCLKVPQDNGYTSRCVAVWPVSEKHFWHSDSCFIMPNPCLLLFPNRPIVGPYFLSVQNSLAHLHLVAGYRYKETKHMDLFGFDGRCRPATIHCCDGRPPTLQVAMTRLAASTPREKEQVLRRK